MKEETKLYLFTALVWLIGFAGGFLCAYMEI
jgi:hypothetical protein